jgi:hypothetical protein
MVMIVFVPVLPTHAGERQQTWVLNSVAADRLGIKLIRSLDYALACVHIHLSPVFL